MKEAIRISKLFADLYNGSPWIDVTLIDTLKNITAEQAAEKIFPDWNSIWEITNHLISWRQNVLQRVQGKIMTSPGHNYFVRVQDVSDAAWTNTLNDLHHSQEQWILLLMDFKEENFEKLYPNNNMTYYENVHGILQHDAYHLGQIVMLAKAFKK